MSRVGKKGDLLSTWGQFVIPLFVIKEKVIVCIGSAVVITLAKSHAIALSAVHVINYGDSLSGVNLVTDESKVAPFFKKPDPFREFVLLPADNDFPLSVQIVSIIYKYKTFAAVKYVSHFTGNDLDIAALALQLPTHAPPRLPMRCAISSRGPKVGDRVFLCGYPAGNAGSTRDNSSFKANLKLESVVGHVTEVFGWNEHHLVKSPGFHVDVHAPSGFSGGGVFLENKELGPILCGTICSSNEFRTTAAMLWPSLGLRNHIPHDSSVPDNLLGLTGMNNAIHDIDKAYDHVKIEKLDPTMTLKDHMKWV